MSKWVDKLHEFVKWHLPSSVATMSQIEEHFGLGTDETAMLEACIKHRLLVEYAVFTNDRQRAYITLKVREARKLLRLRRKNARR